MQHPVCSNVINRDFTHQFSHQCHSDVSIFIHGRWSTGVALWPPPAAESVDLMIWSEVRKDYLINVMEYSNPEAHCSCLCMSISWSHISAVWNYNVSKLCLRLFVSPSRWSQQRWTKGFSQTATARCAALSSSPSPSGSPIMRWRRPLTSPHMTLTHFLQIMKGFEPQRHWADLYTWAQQLILSILTQHTWA